jgi:hypothetical protein
MSSYELLTDFISFFFSCGPSQVFLVQHQLFLLWRELDSLFPTRGVRGRILIAIRNAPSIHFVRALCYW